MHRRFRNDVLPKSTLEDPRDLIEASQTSDGINYSKAYLMKPSRKMLVCQFPPLPPQFQLGCLGAVGDMPRNSVGSLHKTVPRDRQQRALVWGEQSLVTVGQNMSLRFLVFMVSICELLHILYWIQDIIYPEVRTCIVMWFIQS